jgi:hypothetical protein
MNTPISGIYNPDGNKINPNLISVSGLCIACKSYDMVGWVENMLYQIRKH